MSELLNETPRRALAIYAHPDDPDVSCGGTLAAWAAAGCDVHSLICTDGGKGTADTAVESKELVARRVDESVAAGAVLGLTGQVFLGLPDGELEDEPWFRESLVGAIRRLRPDVVLCPDPTALFFGQDYFNHRDHRITGMAVLDAVAGAGVGDSHVAPPPLRPYLSEVGADPGRLRIGVTYGAGGGAVVDPEIVAAVRRTAAALAGLGHEVIETAPPQLTDEAFFGEMSTHFLTAYPVWVAQSIDELGALTGTPATADSVEPLAWALAEMGRLISGVSFADATEGMRRLGRQVQGWWAGSSPSGSVARAADGFDLLLCASVPELAPTLGQFGAEEGNPLAGIFRATSIVANVIPFNITGQPAISVPVAESASGLPIGVQLVGAFGRDDQLVAVGAQLESALPWADRRPGIFAG